MPQTRAAFGDRIGVEHVLESAISTYGLPMRACMKETQAGSAVLGGVENVIFEGRAIA